MSVPKVKKFFLVSDAKENLVMKSLIKESSGYKEHLGKFEEIKDSWRKQYIRSKKKNSKKS